jgi:hypothetical protein
MERGGQASQRTAIEDFISNHFIILPFLPWRPGNEDLFGSQSAESVELPFPERFPIKVEQRFILAHPA